MKTVFLLAALMAWGLSEVRGNFMKSRYMINMVMGRDVIPDYNLYGCYCGLEGKGTPKDGTDRCCWKQDCCYSDLKKYNCDTEKVMYRYRYADGILSCGYGSYCQIRICTCDAQAVSCMLQNRKSYKAKYRNLPNSQCKGKAPKC